MSRLGQLCCCFLVISVLMVGCDSSNTYLLGDGEVKGKYNEDDMAVAVAQARASFDAFLTKAKYPGELDSDFSVKVAIEDGQHTEHIWLNDLKIEQEPFEGTIGNEPYFITNVKFGDRYRFTREDISDWTYVSDGVVQGSYTVRVSMKAMSKAESDALTKQFGW